VGLAVRGPFNQARPPPTLRSNVHRETFFDSNSHFGQVFYAEKVRCIRLLGSSGVCSGVFFGCGWTNAFLLKRNEIIVPPKMRLAQRLTSNRNVCHQQRECLSPTNASSQQSQSHIAATHTITSRLMASGKPVSSHPTPRGWSRRRAGPCCYIVL
jgi:hypothetical protein